MPDRFPANLAGETAGKIFEYLVPEHYHPGMTVALPPGEADREIGLLVPVAAGGFADPQQVFARDREAADQGRVYESEGFFEDAERFDVLASRDDRFCGGVAVMYPVVVEGFGKIDDISPPPIRSVSRTASRRNNGIGCNCRPQGAHCAAPVPFLRCRWCSSGRENGRGRNGCRIGSACVWGI